MADAMDEQLEQLKRLPLRRGETWQGGLVPIPGWVTGEGSEPYRPLLAIWIARHSHKLHLGEMQRPDEASPDAAVGALLAFALESEYGGYRPGRVEVADAELADQLTDLLSSANIQVRLVKQLDLVDEAMEDMAEAMDSTSSALPSPLEDSDVTPLALKSFAAAAAAYYEAAPWQYLVDIDLIEVEQPLAPPGFRYCTVLGAGGTMFGLTFYRSVDELFAFYRTDRDGDPQPLSEFDVWQCSFNLKHELPPGDAEVWEQHDLPVAGRAAYPLLCRFTATRPPARADLAQLDFVASVLQALSATSEEEIDSGRWEKHVAQAGGEIRVVLSLPDLVAPPTFQDWVRRGVEPDRRSHERVFADMDRYFREHPPGDMDDMNRVLAERFAGGRIDEPVTRPTTPLEQAQEICYQAFNTFGRRRVQLAREALACSADCADAFVILAEQSGTREAELENYRQGVAAGRRAMGEEFFQESVGHFWGISSSRPYMRALFGVALTLDRMGQMETAVEHWLEVLRLNPNDNQGARYLLLSRLMRLGRDADAARLLKAYDEESANWAYSRALLAFRLSGRSLTAERELRDAIRCNPHLPPLLADDAMPVPNYYSPGSLDEALVAAEELRPAFEATEGAVDWALATHRTWQADCKKKERDRRQKQRERARKRKRK